ncbi:hypothetical protein FEM48_Zijuj01G0069300 [Ziziphus jujuba var. spinosa]|uniref:(R)-mandelonitrile lyase n=1 Tax=Ziziphus jujuba var. spinosa TaxID=714518 RepID=A0A978VZS3_ZIZJJ|nr:hypothetical protein FEM48_Zijuj01G0069300 [Ziziphus jujuba var. spinosa]
MVLTTNGVLGGLLQEDDGKTSAQRFTSEDGVANVRGRVLGGSSMINVGFYSKPDDQFYNEFGIHSDMDASRISDSKGQLSAGAIGSPQLIFLSGVGPLPYLLSHKVRVVSQNANVGNFMTDNPCNIINIVVPFALDPSVGQVVGIISDFNYIEPLSSGSLRLVSSVDIKVNPTVRFNYFKDPKDLSRCVRGTRLLSGMLKTNAMEGLKFEYLEGAEGFTFLGPSLPRNLANDASMEMFSRSTLMTFWHYHGGCLVGKVVDVDLRVVGTNSLRVVDGSILNTSPGTNP